MLGRSHRFHGHRALNGVYRHGRTVRTAAIGLRYGSRGTDRPYRVAVVVSKKISKSAVTRNRIRRRVYAAVRQAADKPDSAIRPGTDLVFTIFNEQVTGMPSDELYKTVENLLKKAAPAAPGR